MKKLLLLALVLGVLNGSAQTLRGELLCDPLPTISWDTGIHEGPTKRHEFVFDSIVGLMLKDSSMRVSISCNSDYRGSDAYNERLTTAKAKSIRDYFISKGAIAGNIYAIGYGESNPAVVPPGDLYLTPGDTLTKSLIDGKYKKASDLWERAMGTNRRIEIRRLIKTIRCSTRG